MILHSTCLLLLVLAKYNCKLYALTAKKFRLYLSEAVFMKTTRALPNDKCGSFLYSERFKNKFWSNYSNFNISI